MDTVAATGGASTWAKSVLGEPEPASALTELVALLALRHPDEPVLAQFAEVYWGQVAATDLNETPTEELYRVTLAHWELGRTRAPRAIVLDVLSPDGSTQPHSLLLSVCDDAPFLVDSVRIELERQQVGVHLMVHPMISILRDDAGVITGLGEGGKVEAWTLIVIDRCNASRAAAVGDGVRRALASVHQVVGDFGHMRTRMLHVAADLRGDPPAGVPAPIVESVRELLDWLVEGNFVFLAAADYDLDANGELVVVPGTQLGLPSATETVDPPPVAHERLLAVCRADEPASVYRAVRPTCIAVRRFDANGRPAGERRFIGLFSADARRASVMSIPYVRERVEAVLARSGYEPQSHAGRSLRNVLETFPRDELFEMSRAPQFELAMGIVALQDRQLVRVFAEPEPAGPWVTVLVYLPAKRFEADSPARVAKAIAEAFDADRYTYDASVGAGALARINVAVRRQPGPLPDLDKVAHTVDVLTAPWAEFVRETLIERFGEERGLDLYSRVAERVPFSYAVSVEPSAAIDDLELIHRLAGESDRLEVVLAPSSTGDDWRIKLFRAGPPVTLADTMPLLEHLGLRAVDEHPHEFVLPAGTVHLYDIGVRLPDGVVLDEHRRANVEQVFVDLFAGRVESDGFNRLVVSAGLTGRQVEVLRAYGRYLRQIRFPFSQQLMEDTLYRYPRIAAALAELFALRFDPARAADTTAAERARAELVAMLDEVPSLDDDRVGRMFLAVIDATLRTNAFRPADDATSPAGEVAPRSVLAFKLDPKVIPDLPKPRPMFEIWVCSPAVEGVHLRGGRVARGGIRASDRREDFRTEVLGLVKAQMVKNAVIVPVGAKGGFVVKRGVAPEAMRAETEACYRLFIAGLLDVTDNIVRGETVHPPHTVCYDDDDPYLVVAADKGTATFSDVANEISASYGFWLGDAFASGGSAGYDHKEMGITARGAWESVRRHARTLGKNADVDELTVAGIGDMSGDVFGNGMLRSEHLKLVAAFDHRHVFVDPDPDPAASFAERRRLFQLPRSSWADYDPALISAGGGVHPRTAKHIDITPQVAARLGIEVGSLTPNELISAILRAPVDLLWNGGIGTYVKASTESHADVGDRTNDAVRIDATELRCRMIAEGGNLGFTQRGRVEYALAGGLINTDAIDNSAGVDCSDHEVNIKILLAGAIDDGVLPAGERDALLASMTDEVADLVLDDNRSQTLVLAIARRQALPMANVHARYLHALEAEGWIDRALEALPSDKAFAERQAAGLALTTPEFAVLLAYTKTANVAELVAGDLPDDPYLESALRNYFPVPLRQRFTEQIDAHRLRREIIATAVINQMVNTSGISFDHRMTEETGAAVADITRAWVAARDILGTVELWERIEGLGGLLKFDVQLDLFLEARRMLERCTLWLLRHRRPPFDIAATVAELAPGVREVIDALHDVLRGPLGAFAHSLEASRLVVGVPEDLAEASAMWPYAHTAFDIVDATRRVPGATVRQLADIYWRLFEALDVTWLWDGIGALPRADRWQTQSRSALRDDLLAVLIELTVDVASPVSGTPAGTDPAALVSQWLAVNERTLTRMRGLFTEITRTGTTNLTTLTVGVRQLRNLVLGAQPTAAPAAAPSQL